LTFIDADDMVVGLQVRRIIRSFDRDISSLIRHNKLEKQRPGIWKLGLFSGLFLWAIISVANTVTPLRDQVKVLNQTIEDQNNKNTDLSQQLNIKELENTKLNNSIQDLNHQLQVKKEAQTVVASAPAVNVPNRPSNISFNGNVEQWRSLVSQYPWSVNIALKIMACESGGNPNAVSRTNDYGLFQINHGLQNYGTKIYDPDFNVALAYNHFYVNRGWQPWSCARKLGII
jgi:hypothetical protein